MPTVSRDIAEIVDATSIESGSRLVVAGSPHELPANGDPDELRSVLASVLYQRLYSRPTPHQPAAARDLRAARVFVDRLSAANCGTGCWEPGWTVEAINADGTLAVGNRSHELTFWAQPEEFRPQDGVTGPGAEGRLRVGKELRELLPGYYTALGDADPPGADQGSADVVRVYWHLTAEAAPVWIRELTQRFNDAGISFRAKVLNSPAAYFRADAGVLYLPGPHFPSARRLLPDLHHAVAQHLRPTTPMFTKRLAGGLAVAEDPGDGRSFGQDRCALVADGLLDAARRGSNNAPARVAMIAERFAEAGLDVARPWLGAGSRQRYTWPREPRREVSRPR
jgi:hypothetical protein